MNNPIHTPLYRAKSVYSGEWIEGYLDYYYNICKYIIRGIGNIHLTDECKEIDLNTLEITHNGTDWFSMDEFKSVMNDSYKTKSRIAEEKGHNYDETYFR